MTRRVVVTGIGAITPIGLGREGLWNGLRAERSAVGPVTRFDPTPFRSHVAAEVSDFVPTDHLDERRSKRFDRFAQFSVVASRMAIEDASLALEREDRERIGSMMGSALGGVAYAEEQMGRYMSGGLRAVDATLALAVFGGAASCNIAIEFGVYGPNSTNAMSCASGTIAVGDAFRVIRDDYADVMICGGAEAPLSTLCYGAFSLIRAMSTRNDDPATASRPFDRDRDGFVMGEGSAVLILEERERAVARGARIYAEVLGYGMTNDGHHMTAPRPDGSQAARAMRLALSDAHIQAGEIGYVNAHGSSTPLNDPTETLAVKQVFGDHAYRVPVSGTKGYYGHALGASGAIEAAICSLALERKWLPPTVNLESPDPACDLDYVAGSGLDMRRFNKPLAGASWMDEYGNPDLPDNWEYIRKYSPYHNISPDKKYPPTLFTTSTRDDRVHPGHARKMFARLKQLNQDVRYYENIEGGHGGAANNKQAAYMQSLGYAFLIKQLFPTESQTQ